MTATLTIAGDVESFNRTAFTGGLIATFGLAQEEIEVSVAGASIEVDVRMVTTNGSVAEVVMTKLRAGPSYELGLALGVEIESITEPVIVAIVAPAPSAPPPQSPPQFDVRLASTVSSVLVLLLLCFCGALCGLFFRARRRPKGHSTAKWRVHTTDTLKARRAARRRKNAAAKYAPSDAEEQEPPADEEAATGKLPTIDVSPQHDAESPEAPAETNPDEHDEREETITGGTMSSREPTTPRVPAAAHTVRSAPTMLPPVHHCKTPVASRPAPQTNVPGAVVAPASCPVGAIQAARWSRGDVRMARTAPKEGKRARVAPYYPGDDSTSAAALGVDHRAAPARPLAAVLRAELPPVAGRGDEARDDATAGRQHTSGEEWRHRQPPNRMARGYDWVLD